MYAPGHFVSHRAIHLIYFTKAAHLRTDTIPHLNCHCDDLVWKKRHFLLYFIRSEKQKEAVSDSCLQILAGHCVYLLVLLDTLSNCARIPMWIGVTYPETGK